MEFILDTRSTDPKVNAQIRVLIGGFAPTYSQPAVGKFKWDTKQLDPMAVKSLGSMLVAAPLATLAGDGKAIDMGKLTEAIRALPAAPVAMAPAPAQAQAPARDAQGQAITLNLPDPTEYQPRADGMPNMAYPRAKILVPREGDINPRPEDISRAKLEGKRGLKEGRANGFIRLGPNGERVYRISYSRDDHFWFVQPRGEGPRILIAGTFRAACEGIALWESIDTAPAAPVAPEPSIVPAPEIGMVIVHQDAEWQVVYADAKAAVLVCAALREVLVLPLPESVTLLAEAPRAATRGPYAISTLRA